MQKRRLGKRNLEVSALGLGCMGLSAGYGPPVGKQEGISLIRSAVERGLTFFDTAEAYGPFTNEELVGEALAPFRDQVVIATKFGNLFDAKTREMTSRDGTPDGVRRQLADSLRRLGTDHVDLYQLHLGDFPIVQALELVPVLDELVARGDIRAYGWSTDYPDRATAFAMASHSVVAIQHDFSVLKDSAGVLAVCERFDLASVNRGPLAMGLLTGKYTESSRLGEDDIRGVSPDWLRYFQDGRPSPEFLARLDSVRDVLCSGGRTLAQGAIGYLWARSDRTIPIPGCRTVAQVEENAGALAFGPLTKEQVAEVDQLLGRG
jgi:aryl-alcohol dehydrogenase-like predicted oxidoreductase